MELTVTLDPSEAWGALTRGFTGDPAVSNWILSAINKGRDQPTRSPIALLSNNGAVSGVAFLAAGSHRLDVSPLSRVEAQALARALFAEVDRIDGVLGPAAAAAHFAGAWSELADVGARPTDGGRVCEVRDLVLPSPPAAGRPRLATENDVSLLVDWNEGFSLDTDVAPPQDAERHLAAHVASGLAWAWQTTAGPTAMALLTEPVMHTRRIAHVYTPGPQRGHGFASALVAAIASETLTSGDRCMLHTQLSNPASNRVYRRLGFEAISESVFYEFSG